MVFLARDVTDFLHDFASFVILLSEFNNRTGPAHFHSILKAISKKATSVILLYGIRDPVDAKIMIPLNIEKMVYYAHLKENVSQLSIKCTEQ